MEHSNTSRLLHILLPALLASAAPMSLQAQPGTWTQLANFGGGLREGAVAFSIGTKGYVGTGLAGAARKKDFWEYDPATDAWTQKADFGGTARRYAAGFSIGNKGYIGAGNATDGRKKDFWEYDPVANAWTQKADCGGPERVYATGLSIGNKGYMGMGFNLYDEDMKDFWEYDPATNAWTQRANFGGTARDGAVGFGIGNKGYIGTGYDANGVTTDFWEFDPAANTWAQKAPLAGAGRYNASGFSIGALGYIGTGDSGNGYLGDFWAYDPSADTWTQVADFGGGLRQRAAGFSIGAKGYVGIGSTSAQREDLWVFTGGQVQPGISCSADTGPFCTNGTTTVQVTFEAAGSFNAGNTFTVQLSDAAGSFTAPVTIGSLQGTTDGTITCLIPGGLPEGSGYRIRVTASDPQITGSDNGMDITLAAAPTAQLAALGPVAFCEGGSVQLEATGNDPQATYAWFLDGGPLPGDAATLQAEASGTYTVVANGAGGCASGPSDAVEVTVNPPPPVPGIIQEGDTLRADGTGTFQWYVGGNPVPDGTGPSLIPATTGDYTVTVTDGNGCSSTSEAYHYIPMGMAGSTTGVVTVSPNPGDGAFTLSLPQGLSVGRYEVLDATGQAVQEGGLEGLVSRLDLTGQAPGIYLLRILSGHGTHVLRVVKR